MIRLSLPSLLVVVGLQAACTALPADAVADPNPPEDPECRAETYDFVGRGTLKSLGILHPDRADARTDFYDVPGTFWVPQGVTRQYERDDGRTEEVRVFCATLDDGGTLINLPVAPWWQPSSKGPL